jgi:hypothetical protein
MIHWIEEEHIKGETLVVRDGDTEWAAASVCLKTLKAVAAADMRGRGAWRAKLGEQSMSNAESPVEGEDQEMAVNPRGLSRRHDSVDV